MDQQGCCSRAELIQAGAGAAHAGSERRGGRTGKGDYAGPPFTPLHFFFHAFYFFSLKAGVGGGWRCSAAGGAFGGFLVFCLPASCCFAKARGAPVSRSPAAWMPVDVMIAPSEDQFWTDMREGQMKLKIRVRRMKESRDMRGLSAGRLLSFRWGRRGKRGLLRALLCLGDGDRLCQAADGERSATAGDTKSAGSWRAGRWRRAGTWRRAESVQRGSDPAVPSHGQCAGAPAEAASLVLQAAAGKDAGRGQLLRAGERLPAAVPVVRAPVRAAWPGGTALGSPEPFSIQASLVRVQPEQRRRRREGGRLREPGQALPPASPLPRVPVLEG